MKVILMTGYGVGYLPKELGHIDFSNFLWRIDKEIIEKLENLNWFVLDNSYKKDGRYYKYTYNNDYNKGVKYLFPNPDSPNNYTSVSIVEVDTSRPWIVEEYDGSESIRYIDEFFCVSEEANFHIVRIKGNEV